jgi:hypothetical protein
MLGFGRSGDYTQYNGLRNDSAPITEKIFPARAQRDVLTPQPTGVRCGGDRNDPAIMARALFS